MKVLLAGWAFFGHLVIIDDDLPGGWAEGSRAVPGKPFMELVLKLVLLFASIGLFLQEP